MTDRRAVQRRQRLLEAVNVGSETIPPFAAVEIEAVSTPDASTVVYHVRRPTRDSAPQAAINGPTKIAVGGFGNVTLDLPVFALYDEADAAPTAGTELGTQKDSFQLKRARRGFLVLGGADADRHGAFVLHTAAAGELVRFELTQTKAHNDDSTVGKRLAWNGSAYETTGDEIALVDSVGQWTGEMGYQGWATAQRDRSSLTLGETTYPAYEIVFLESKARHIEFTLTQDMQTNSSPLYYFAQATVDRFWGDAPNGRQPLDVVVRDYQGFFRFAKNGARGKATYYEPEDYYRVDFSHIQASLIYFTLNEDPSAGLAAATADSYWGPLYGTQDPGSTVTIGGLDGLATKSGAAGLGVLNVATGRYLPVWIETLAGFVAFRITSYEGVSPGEALADVLKYWGSEHDVLNPGDTVVLVNPPEPWFTGELGQFMDGVGALGVAARDAATGKYVMVRCDEPALWVRFAASSSFSLMSGGWNASVLDFGAGRHPDPDDDGIIVVNLPTSGGDGLFSGDEGARGLALRWKRDVDTSKWIYQCTQVECP